MCEIFMKLALYVVSFLWLSSNMMVFKLKGIVLILSLLEALVLVQTLEEKIVEYQNLHKEACVLMLVSHAGTTKGKDIRKYFFSI